MVSARDIRNLSKSDEIELENARFGDGEDSRLEIEISNLCLGLDVGGGKAERLVF